MHLKPKVLPELDHCLPQQTAVMDYRDDSANKLWEILNTLHISEVLDYISCYPAIIIDYLEEYSWKKLTHNNMILDDLKITWVWIWVLWEGDVNDFYIEIRLDNETLEIFLPRWLEGEIRRRVMTHIRLNN